MTRRTYVTRLPLALLCFFSLIFAATSAFAVNNVQYKNISASYAVGVWAGVDRNGVGVGPAVELFPGASAFPRTLTRGNVTLYIAYGPSKNLIRGWTRLVNPNMKVTIPNAPLIKIEARGFNQVFVNGVKAKNMY